MSEDTPFVGEPADSREAIMYATYVALHKYGYAGLSIQNIADEADLSKSTFYHHFDGKEDLLLAFVEYTLEEMVRVFTLEAGEDPEANLRTFVTMLVDPDPDLEREIPPDRERILGSYVELRAQAVRDETIRQKFTQADEAFTQRLATVIRNGIAADVFEPVDPDATAQFLVTVIEGNLFRESTRDDYDADAVLAELDEFVERRLLA